MITASEAKAFSDGRFNDHKRQTETILDMIYCKIIDAARSKHRSIVVALDGDFSYPPIADAFAVLTSKSHGFRVQQSLIPAEFQSETDRTIFYISWK